MDNLALEILETWQINHRTNLLLIDSLSEEALELTTSPRGGGKVGHQLAHMHNIRFWKAEKFDKTLTKDLRIIKAEDKKSLAMLKKQHEISASFIETMLKSGIEHGKIKGWKRGVVSFLGSFIHHEAHHRGNILLTLKLRKYKLPIALKYGIWEWNKI